MSDPQTLKEQGNEHFKAGDYKEAEQCYTEALSAGPLNEIEMAVIYKNRAQSRLKLNDNLGAVEDCTASLELVGNDPKALFRRCQAYEALGKSEEAYKDVVTLVKVDPKNSAAAAIYQRLHPLVQDKLKEMTSLSSKVSQMFNLAFDKSMPSDKRSQAFNNLIVLSRESSGSDLIIRQGSIPRLVEAMKEKDNVAVTGALKVLASLCKNSQKRAAEVVKALDITFVMTLLGQGSTEVTTAATHLVQMMLNWYVGLEEYQLAVEKCEEAKKKGERVKWPRLQLSEEHQAFVDQVFRQLVKMFDSSKVTPEGRDSAMELVMKNVTYKKGLGWTQKFLDTNGIEGLLTVAGTQKQFKTLAVTDDSRMHASVTLSTIYDDTVSDKQREQFKDKCSNFLRELFADEDMESKIEAIEIVSTLLQGPYEVGSVLLGIDGVVQIMLTLAASDNLHYQRVAVEAIVNSASKKDRCAGILKDAVPILKDLYKSSDETIQVRALVGLCKLGSFTGGDVSDQPMADGSTLKLARICRKFLVNTSKDCDLRKWATEGLAYLTLDAEVKEELVDDAAALKSIFDLAKSKERNMTYACITVLVNVTNSYDKQDINPELVELAKFAKQHVPQEHEKDKHDYIVQRIHKLAKVGVTNALVALSDTESKNSRELLCRVYLALATEESLRGLLVQQGAVKSLLQLINNNTENGSILAAHSLAKIAVTMDPSVAFPGQRVYEVVRPLISLLHNDRTGLQNFEALLALTNLASFSENVRNRILADQGLHAIERCMFEDHDMIRRAATECMCNMLMSEKVQQMAEGDNDRVKVMVLFASEDDLPLVKAATGALAFMSANPKLCKKMTQVKSWLEIIQQVLVSEDRAVQHRACHLAMNLMAADEDIAAQLVQSPVLEILMAISKLQEAGMEEIHKCAQQALDSALSRGLIRPVDSQAASMEALRQALNIRKLAFKEQEEEEEDRKAEEERKNYRNKQLKTEAEEEFEAEVGDSMEEADKTEAEDKSGETAAQEANADPTDSCTEGQGQEAPVMASANPAFSHPVGQNQEVSTRLQPEVESSAEEGIGSGESAGSGDAPVSGEAASPTTVTVSEEAASPTSITVSEEAASPTTVTVSGEAASPTSVTVSEEATLPTTTTESFPRSCLLDASYKAES